MALREVRIEIEMFVVYLFALRFCAQSEAGAGKESERANEPAERWMVR